MPLTCDLDESNQIISLVADASTTLFELSAAVSSLIRDEMYPLVAPILLDVQKLAISIDDDVLEKLIVLLRILRNRFQNKIAFLVSESGMIFGYTLLVTQSTNTQLFSSRDKAIEWLLTR